MSGIEAVGLVLGTIPLILVAIEKYKAVHSWRKYTRELNSLRRSLSAELTILESTCERLLIGLVAETDIESMIREPFGPLWKNGRIHDSIRQRLWKAYGSFEGTVRDMNEVVNELRVKLGASKATKSAPSPIADGLERVRFVLNRSQYAEMLKVITDGNATLSKLVDLGVNEGMESSRQVRSAARFFNLTRRLSQNAFNAIRCSLSCRCPVSHTVNLELQPPYVQPTPYDDDEAVVRQIFFRLTLMYDPSNRKAKRTTWLWDEVEMRAELERPPEPPITVICKPATNPGIKQKKRVNFTALKPDSPRLGSQVQTMVLQDSLATAITSLSIGAATLGIPKLEAKMRELGDLCHVIQEAKSSGRLPGTSCYGYVMDKSASIYNKFGVYPVQHPQIHNHASEECSILTLGQVLEGAGKSLPSLSFRQKQTLAATVASNVLQLAKSPWLPDVFDSKDILFVNLDGSPSYDHAFVSKRLPERDRPESVPQHEGDAGFNVSSIIQNGTIFSLGIVLLELALGKRLRSLRDTTTRTAEKEEKNPSPDEAVPEARRRDLLLDYETALQHLNAVDTEMGPNYYDAVRRCIRCEFMHPTLDLEDDGFRQEVFGRVVALLESNLKNMNSSTRSFTR
ncbi:hypothetical protein PGQ11_014948 [Apiospora arundinis]|uniref:DUF7580 domain-containing protein n=1 Tax=Apiospora arundinis TaxID=335852 RepID=A0ABR2HJU6_9PEZI